MKPISMAAFHAALHEEHLEEIDFLYAQRRQLLLVAGRRWLEMDAVETRIEAHIDALLVGGDGALAVCRRRAVEGDPGELFGAVVVFCRHKDAAALAHTLQSLDGSDARKLRAVSDALKHESPREWSNFIGQALARRDPRLAPVLAPVAGYRRMHATASALAQCLAAMPEHALPFVEALGRLHGKEAHELLSRQLQHEQEPVRAAALLALLRCGHEPAVIQMLQDDPLPDWAYPWLALGAPRLLAERLRQRLLSPKVPRAVLHAAGLLGEPSLVRALLPWLEDEELAADAALALHWITGAPLQETVFVDEQVDEALLFKHEAQAWKQYKQAPKRLDGKPYGEDVQRLSTDAGRWLAWVTEAAPRFQAGQRYRLGQPASAAGLLGQLAHPASDPDMRQLVALELEIRYACSVPFEIDLPVAAQQSALQQMHAWLQGRGGGFEPGRWYWAGRPA